jgi:hypothetical protein
MNDAAATPKEPPPGVKKSRLSEWGLPALRAGATSICSVVE